MAVATVDEFIYKGSEADALTREAEIKEAEVDVLKDGVGDTTGVVELEPLKDKVVAAMTVFKTPTVVL